ncbi:type I DNA topoisomerase [Malacoplasma muris]|uniref:type I DNA topoisomerase n=1 Tax=Malacoplasma muris TaxID=2119 RepID=UPI00398F87F7
MRKLLVIESPNKIKTLSKYLDSDFEIIATIGHIRDMSPFGMGFDKETLEPKWIVPKASKKKTKNDSNKEEIVKEILKKSSKADEIYLATDPDREGEAIAWHVFDVLDKKDQAKCKRIAFNEITKTAVLDSFNNKRDIDFNLVHSQFSRRVTDRLIGFKLSRLMNVKLKAESAGRVQSVALKFIEDREKEINAFKPDFWFTLDAVLVDGNSLILKSVSSSLNNINVWEKSFSTGVNFSDKESANAVLNSLNDEFIVSSIEEPSYSSSSPKPVYKTSTLQQDAINKLGWSSKKTTIVAQRLYEGIDVDGNQIALISYPRTDSVRLSNTFIDACQSFIKKEFGNEYLGDNSVNKLTKEKQGANVQDAHEGIRPIDVSITPKSLQGKISKDDLSLYKLIWERTLASLMSNAKFKRVTIKFDNNGNEFYTFSRECIFDGFRKVYVDYEDKDKEAIIDLSKYKIDSKFKSKSIEVNDHQTTPPPRYTQATLIAELEKAGVGRPSTYSSMANIALERGYAELDKRSFVMTDMGKEVIAQLEKYFPDVINKDFTKGMEEHLDKIASGTEDWKQWIKEFLPIFNNEVDNAYQNMEKKEDEKVGRDCPKCGKELLVKHARRGGSKFIGCSGYPECTYLEPFEKPQILEQKCPECNSDLLMRKSKRGSSFVGCSGYPKCNYIMSDKAYNKFISENPNQPLPNKKQLEESKKSSIQKLIKKS